MKLIGAVLFSATGAGMLSQSLAFAESSLKAVLLLLAVVGFYFGIKKHLSDLFGTDTQKETTAKASELTAKRTRLDLAMEKEGAAR